jgi:hypothetical protein
MDRGGEFSSVVFEGAQEVKRSEARRAPMPMMGAINGERIAGTV